MLNQLQTCLTSLRFDCMMKHNLNIKNEKNQHELINRNCDKKYFLFVAVGMLSILYIFSTPTSFKSIVYKKTNQINCLSN